MDSYKTIEQKLRNGETFRGNTLTGIWDSDSLTYSVYSYSTLIATKKRMPDNRISTWLETRKYSVTTSKHQNLIKRVWAVA